MNEAIINPIWFYLINVFENLGCVFKVILVVCIVLLLILLDILIECEIEYKKIFKVLIITLVVSLIGVTFIPSKETMYTMMVANVVTYENVETATEAIKDGVDYIFEKLDVGDKE